jgi:hypothetical protein
MTDTNWIIYERMGGWAAALRVAAARSAPTSRPMPRIYEVRSLDELSQRLANRSGSLALLEVHSLNLGKVLPWLAHNSRQFPCAHFFALLDRSLRVETSPETTCSAGDTPGVVGALLEAGVGQIADSPRRLRHILALAERRGAFPCEPRRPTNQAQSIADWAWSQLPWQPDRE